MKSLLALLILIFAVAMAYESITAPPPIMTEAEIAQEIFEKEERELYFMSVVSPPGATDFTWLGNSWFEYCFDGVKIMQHYRKQYREGYSSAMVVGKCE